jgi:hypothetical protein
LVEEALSIALVDAVHELVDGVDDDLTVCPDQLGAAVVDDVRFESFLREAKFTHLCVVSVYPVDYGQQILRSKTFIIGKTYEEVVHLIVVDVGVCLHDLPLLGHEIDHSQFHGVEIVEVPLKVLVDLLRLLVKLLPRFSHVCLADKLDCFCELVLVPAQLLRSSRNGFKARCQVLVLALGVLQGLNLGVCLLLFLDDDGETHHQAVAARLNQFDHVDADFANVLVKALDHVVKASEQVLYSGAILKGQVVDELGRAVLGVLDLVHGDVANIAQLSEAVVDCQQVRLVCELPVVLVQQILKLAEALVEGLNIAAHLLDTLEVAVGLGNNVYMWEVLDHVLSLGAQLVDLHHLLLDQIDGALALGDAVHARLGQLQLLAQAMAQLPVDGRLFSCELGFQRGDLVEVFRVPQQLRKRLDVAHGGALTPVLPVSTAHRVWVLIGVLRAQTGCLFVVVGAIVAEVMYVIVLTVVVVWWWCCGELQDTRGCLAPAERSRPTSGRQTEPPNRTNVPAAQSPRHPPVQSPNSLRLPHSYHTFLPKHPRTSHKQPTPSSRLQSHQKANPPHTPHHGRRRPQPVRRNRNRRLLLRRDAADLPPPVPLRRSLRDQHF